MVRDLKRVWVVLQARTGTKKWERDEETPERRGSHLTLCAKHHGFANLGSRISLPKFEMVCRQQRC